MTTRIADLGSSGGEDVHALIAHNRYRSPGGEERHVDLLEETLPRVGVAVSRLDVDSATIPDTPLARGRVALGLAYRPSGGRRVADALGRVAADVVHFHNLAPLLTPAALRAAKRRGAAVVVTIANFRFACPAGTLVRGGKPHEDCLDGSSLACGLRNSRGAWLESVAYGVALETQRRLRLLDRWVDAYVAPSSYLAERAARSGLPGDRIHVIANGVPAAPLSDTARRFALYAGRLSREKGVDVLLAAADAAGAPVVVAGDGPLRPAVEAANGRVRYEGRVGEDRLAQLRSQALCAIVPSTGPDVLPFSAVEALAAGVPVVASRVGGLPEIVDDGESGILVPPGDARALAAAVRSLADDPPAAAAMGRAGRAAAAERFDVLKQTAVLADLYRSLV